MKGRLYVLSGASGCGKTTLLNQLCFGNTQRSQKYSIERAPKYSEREERTNQEYPDDVTHVDRITLGDFDIAYVLNNTVYGLRVEEIRQRIDDGRNCFLIVSDLRVVQRLQGLLPDRVVSIYISSTIDPARLRRVQMERLGFRPDNRQKEILASQFDRIGAAARLGWWDRVSACVTDLEEIWHAYATDARSTEIRAQKIRAFHIRYIEYVSLFDHVILNYTEDAPEEMSIQAEAILRHDQEFPEGRAATSWPPIFVVLAASGSGKGTLMEMLNLIGSDRVKIASKVADRPPKPGDRRDGMIAIGKEEDKDYDEPVWPDWWTDEMKETARGGEIPQHYEVRWRFHEVDYAVSQEEIERNIQSGMPQIFVSNMEQIERFQKLWPGRMVFIYLHRLTSAQEQREYQLARWEDQPHIAELRIAERKSVHAEYMNHIGSINHVLLNTSFKEDLYDQMFRILRFYYDTLGPEATPDNSIQPLTDSRH